MVVCVPYPTSLPRCALKGTRIGVGAQNCHWAEPAHYTGEISAEMLGDLGA